MGDTATEQEDAAHLDGNALLVNGNVDAEGAILCCLLDGVPAVHNIIGLAASTRSIRNTTSCRPGQACRHTCLHSAAIQSCRLVAHEHTVHRGWGQRPGFKERTGCPLRAAEMRHRHGIRRCGPAAPSCPTSAAKTQILDFLTSAFLQRRCCHSATDDVEACCCGKTKVEAAADSTCADRPTAAASVSRPGGPVSSSCGISSCSSSRAWCTCQKHTATGLHMRQQACAFGAQLPHILSTSGRTKYACWGAAVFPTTSAPE